MSQPITDIIRRLTGITPPDGSDAALDAFKRQIWHKSFWVAGTNELVENSGLQITMNLADPVNGTNNIMRVFVDKDQAVAQFGDCFALTFRVILVFAESARMDAYLFEGDDGMLIAHDQLMALRDQVAMGGEGVPMSEQEALQQRAAGAELAKRARAYCAGQSDIESLHLAMLMMPGVKPVFAGTLKSVNTQQHVDALTRISHELLRPRWRFSLFDNIDGDESIASMLKQVDPCFDRVRDTGMWNKFKNAFSSPVLGICKVEMDPDPTAMALEESNVPEWASS